MEEIRLQEVLDLQYLEGWQWSPDGERIAYLLDDGGVTDLWCVRPTTGGSTQISAARRGVSGFSWHPTGAELLYVQDGDLHLATLDGDEHTTRALTRTDKTLEAPAFSPDGRNFAFVCEGDLWIQSREENGACSLRPPRGHVVANAFAAPDALLWSPGGDKLLFHFRDEDKLMQLGLASDEGRLLWRTGTLHEMNTAVCWLDEHTFMRAVSEERSTVRTFYRAILPVDAARIREEIATGDHTAAPPLVDVQEEPIYRQEARGTPGPLRVSGAWPEPDGGRILFLSEDDGWGHLYLFDPERGGDLEQLTSGECEDFGHMGDAPCWAPDGRYVCYASNRTASGQRQLWLLNVDERRNYQLTDLPGTSVQPKWAPDGRPVLAFLHCDAHRSADLWVVDLAADEIDGNLRLGDEDEFRILTHTKPREWSEDKDIIPQEVTFPGAHGWDIHGYLLSPPGAEDAGEEVRHPAVVWVHGGPIRQMRDGFHPFRSYALFYAFSQYLAHRGYATLMVNFRGGIGYGREFRNGIYGKMGVDDVKDVVAAGHYLKDLPYVDEERVGVWGLSYGGYMTLTALTKHPEEFRMGINLAGIWDFAQWIQWIHSRHGRHTGGFDVYFQGTPDQNPELYRVGSPCTYRENLRRPIINFHGTADANVDFAQMDRIVKDCVALGRDYEAYYYPDEAHTFVHRATWADAFRKIEREFERHLCT